MSGGNFAVKNLKGKEKFKLSKFLTSWEMTLVYLLILVNVLLIVIRPNLYFSKTTVPSIIRSGMDLSIMVLGMVMVLLLGEIDVSVGSIMLLSCTVIGEIFHLSGSWALALLGGILTGCLCGLINGLLVSKIKIPSVIVTIATALVFKGVVKVALKEDVLAEFPEWFYFLYDGEVLGVPLALLYFFVFAIIFGVVIHKTTFGRKLYLIGSNKKAAEYSGIRVGLITVVVFIIVGISAAFSGVLFIGRFGGISPSMAQGYELRVIAIAVLGGVSTKGGKGKVIGVVISTLFMTFLCRMFDIINLESNVQKIITGIILIIAVIIPTLNKTKKAESLNV